MLIVSNPRLELNHAREYNAKMAFKQFINQQTVQIDNALNSYMLTQQKKLATLNLNLGALFNSFIQTNKDGKRLRALLVKIGYLMAGGRSNHIMDVMMAIEIFHTAILAHDDIIDQSPLRRGKPTLYHALGNDHHGISQTIILADYGFFLASKLISESKFSEKYKNRAIQIFNQIVLDTAIGEMIDIEIPFQKTELNQSDAEIIALFKTARYTFTGPLQIGAALAGADTKLLKQIQEAGDDIGIAFQIQDDILGVFGDTDTTGKSNLSDIQEGKVTLLAAFAFKNSDQKTQSLLKKLYGKKDLTFQEADEVRGIFKSCGALDFSWETALKYTESAILKIRQLDVSQKYQLYLQDLADFLMERKK